MEKFDKSKFERKLLAESWRLIEIDDPSLARVVRQEIDRGEIHSQDFYAGVNRGLLQIGKLGGKIFADPRFSTLYAAYLAYSEYKMQNT